MTDTVAHGRGRLTPERTQEVYDAVLALVVEHGYEGLTMDAVAHAASISKATLYRQWGGKPSLVIDAIDSNHPSVELDEIDTGSLRSDLHEWVRVSIQRSGDNDTGLIHAIMHACSTNEELRTVVRDRMINRKRGDFVALFTRAAERGEIASDAPALPYVPMLIVGPFLLRELVDDLPPDEPYLLGLIDTVVLPALGIN